MTETMIKAIEKIDKEAEKSGHFGKLFSQYVIDNLIYDDESANKILDENKSLKELTDIITGKARKSAKNGVAVVADDVVFTWVNEYFGTSEQEKEEAEEVKAEPKKSNIIDVDFDSFM